MAGAGDDGTNEDLLAELSSPGEPPDSGEVLPGSLGERYEVVARLGSGAFGDVFRALDRVLGREVAIKRIRGGAFADAAQWLEVEHRLIREAQVAARLRHPGIVTTHDIVSSGGSSFIVMEYVAGHTLQSLLAERGRFGPDETLRIVAQVASALDHAHAAGVVHRDVKPSNVMVEPSGQVKVMDFGIAKVDAGGQLTATGAIMGTPNYMSPEQARAEPVDARSDLFSLGCILYECLTGIRPFQADSLTGILLRVVAEEPPAADLNALGLPPAIQGVLSRAMAKDPAARFESGAALIDALCAAAGRMPPESGAHLAAPLTRVSQPRAGRTKASSSRRWRWLAGLAFALAGALTAGALAWRIAADPHAEGSPAGGPLVVQEPRGIVDRLLHRTPRLRVTIPAGTWLRLSLETPLSSENATAGQPVVASTVVGVRVGGLEVVPRGTRVAGRVQKALAAARSDGQGELVVAFESLALDGESITIATTPLTMRAPAPRREKPGRKNKVVGAVTGLIARIRGSNGTTEGGSAGTAAASSAGGREIVLREQAPLAVTLAEPVTFLRVKPGAATDTPPR